MSANAIDDESGRFYVLVNDEEQYSLWPSFAEIPAGWRIAFGAADRESALGYVDKTWVDMRPRSLRDTMDSASAADRALGGLAS